VQLAGFAGSGLVSQDQGWLRHRDAASDLVRHLSGCLAFAAIEMYAWLH
jgi:hypothetical protein